MNKDKFLSKIDTLLDNNIFDEDELFEYIINNISEEYLDKIWKSIDDKLKDLLGDNYYDI